MLLPRVTLLRVTLPRAKLPRVTLLRVTLPRAKLPRVTLPRLTLPRMTIVAERGSELVALLKAA